MADVRPFRGIRFDPARVDIGAVVCPPYDVISPAEQRAYHLRDAHNIIRVELGEGPTDPDVPGNRYERRRPGPERLAGRWLPAARAATDRLSLRAGLPAGGETRHRRGLLVAGRLHDPAPTGVLPHEDTRKGPIDDRLALLRATATNVSPLWLLYDDGDGQVGRAIARAWESPAGGGRRGGGRFTPSVGAGRSGDAARHHGRLCHPSALHRRRSPPLQNGAGLSGRATRGRRGAGSEGPTRGTSLP